MRLSNSFSKFAFPIVMLFCIQVSAQSIDFTMGGMGLTSLTYGSKLVVTSANNGMLLPQGNRFKRADGTTYSATIASTYTQDVVNKIITQTTANKFSIQCHYTKVSDTRLDFKIVAKNLSTDTLTSISGKFLTIISDTIPQSISSGCSGIMCFDGNMAWDANNNLYSTPDFTQGSLGGWNNNEDGGPGVVYLGLGFCNIGICNMSDPNKSYVWQVKPSSGGSKTLNFTFSLEARVAPNKNSDTCNISFRFVAPKKLTVQEGYTLCSDAVMRYGGEFPSKVNWPDRRPIGADWLASTDNVVYPPNNPNKWFLDQSLDVTTTSGLENFRTRMLSRASSTVSVLRRIKAQGLITWNIEGQGFDPTCEPVNYPGDPDMATTLAPEWNYKGSHSDSIIDEYLKTFTNAGIIPGFCIRPQKIMMVNGRWQQVGTESWDVNPNVEIDPAQEIFEDVDYAYKRWGARLFYMDSNVWDPMEPSAMNVHDVITKALIAHPDVLILGEWQTFNYFQWSTVYDEAPWADTKTPDGVRMIYPNAFSVLQQYRGGAPFSIAQWVTAAKKGEIYLVHGWFSPSEHDSIIKINSICGVRPYNVKLNAPSNGAVLGTTFTMTATASDSGANAGIDSVEFLSSGIKLGVAKTAPYSFTWTNALPGKHSLYARAIDKTKNQACSQPVNVVVDATAIRTIDGPMLRNTLKGPINVSVYSLNGRLIRKVDSKDPTRLLTPVVLRGLSSGIYIMKIKHANGAIDKRKMEVVW